MHTQNVTGEKTQLNFIITRAYMLVKEEIK